jgi:hypothetical protein
MPKSKQEKTMRTQRCTLSSLAIGLSTPTVRYKRNELCFRINIVDKTKYGSPSTNNRPTTRLTGY